MRVYRKVCFQGLDVSFDIHGVALVSIDFGWNISDKTRREIC